MFHENRFDVDIEDLDPWQQVKLIAEHLAYFGWDSDYVEKLYEISLSECNKEDEK
jgi:hypothetical protein